MYVAKERNISKKRKPMDEFLDEQKLKLREILSKKSEIKDKVRNMEKGELINQK